MIDDLRCEPENERPRQTGSHQKSKIINRQSNRMCPAPGIPRGPQGLKVEGLKVEGLKVEGLKVEESDILISAENDLACFSIMLSWVFLRANGPCHASPGQRPGESVPPIFEG